MAAGMQRVYEQRIKSTETLKKVFRAMELIAASRIGKARTRAMQGTPYARALSQALAALVVHSDLDHPMLNANPEGKKVALVVVTSDRGMAGSYSASVLRETETQIKQFEEDGKEPVLFVLGRRGSSFFRFRGREVAASWEGHSDAPRSEDATEVADQLFDMFHNDPDLGEVYIIFTRYISMVKQVVEVRRLMPIEVVDADDEAEAEALPLYEFEPSVDEALAVLLPLYLRSRVFNHLLHAAASELASRQQAMHTATQNAEDLIRDYTRLKNAARQADITQEISEIVSGADALASS